MAELSLRAGLGEYTDTPRALVRHMTSVSARCTWPITSASATGESAKMSSP
ncbi:hypothetical protein AS96_10270 [Microbacterium sp. MRS-1]|nr:hypothetical protein AS96_10270 [Microbacterium sp. MRS-1]